MKKRKFLFRLLAALLIAALFSGCMAEGAKPAAAPTETPGPEVRPAAKEEATEGHLLDDKSLYEGLDGSSVITMYLTVSSGNAADGSDHTWAEINTYSTYDYENMGVDRYKVEGLLQIDETGNGLTKDSFGYGETVPNVSVQVRGQTSTRDSPKNYKLRIKEGRGLFRDQRTLNLNKHKQDPFRFTNKLAYDLLNSVPQLIGGRTQFVHLYVKDTTAGGDGEFQDYGLYTMVEQVNRRFLKNRGLDENGQLYKVTFFEWYQYPEIMIPEEDPDFDEDAFEAYMEVKGDEDHALLRQVLEELGNYTKPIRDIVEEYFDAENLCYWMAFNILTGNYDSGERNLFLYSPLNSRRFYIICWDLDVTFTSYYYQQWDYSEGGSWEQGMSKFLGLLLINRMMKEAEYRQMLTAAVEDIYEHYVNAKTVRTLADRYARVTRPFLFGGADTENTPIRNEEDYDALVARISEEPELMYHNYLETLQRPWPFFVNLPYVNAESGRTEFSWGVSYEVHGEPVTYDYILARDYDFTDVITSGERLTVPFFTWTVLPPGVYFLKVTATNRSGYTTDCFDYIFDHDKHYGCYSFVVEADGTIVYNWQEG